MTNRKYDRQIYRNRYNRESVFDNETLTEALIADMLRAVSIIIIQTAYLSERGLDRFLSVFQELIARGVRICIFVGEPWGWQDRHKTGDEELKKVEKAIAKLEAIGVHVTMRRRLHQKSVVIDSEIVWDGSPNIMSFYEEGTTERFTRKISMLKAMFAIQFHNLNTCFPCEQQERMSPLPGWLTVTQETFGPMIKWERQKRGIAQEPFSTAIELNRTLVSHIESGKRSVNLKIARLMASALNLELILVPRHSVPFVEQLIKNLPTPAEFDTTPDAMPKSPRPKPTTRTLTAPSDLPPVPKPMSTTPTQPPTQS